ncbi:MAG: ABC transporter permease [Lacunisphaera sp.]|nr:ABC transporter permease [Lacunisphaera sp.]
MVAATPRFSIPVLWLGFLLRYIFAVMLSPFPAAGYIAPSDGFGPLLHRLAMPAFATGLIVMARITRMTRVTALKTLSEDYIRTASAKGLAERLVLICHGFPGHPQCGSGQGWDRVNRPAAIWPCCGTAPPLPSSAHGREETYSLGHRRHAHRLTRRGRPGHGTRAHSAFRSQM